MFTKQFIIKPRILMLLGISVFIWSVIPDNVLASHTASQSQGSGSSNTSDQTLGQSGGSNSGGNSNSSGFTSFFDWFDGGGPGQTGAQAAAQAAAKNNAGNPGQGTGGVSTVGTGVNTRAPGFDTYAEAQRASETLARSLNISCNCNDYRPNTGGDGMGGFQGGVNIAIESNGGGSASNAPGPQPTRCNTTPNPNLVIQDILFFEVVNGVVGDAINQNLLKTGGQYQPVLQIFNLGCASTADIRFHKDEAPFGVDGSFPVRLRVDYGKNVTYEVTNYSNSVNALGAARGTNVVFPIITIPTSGLHKIEGVVDIKGSDDVGRGCTGAWGCIAERGNPTSNTREEDFTAVAPSVNLQSYLVKPHNIFSGEVPTDLRAGDRNYSGQTRRLGLFWTGTLVNLTNCTGTAVTSLGAPTLDFNGRPDPTTVSSRNSRYVSRLGTSNYDYNITEPPRGTNHVYTINCSTSDGQTVSDTIVISNNGPASPASATLSGTDCIIASGADSCASELTWDIVSAAAPNIFNDTHNQQYSTATKQTNVRYSIERGDNDIQARDGGSVLEEETVTATCAITAPWSASLGICFNPSAAASSTPLTITLTAQSKFVRMNESTRITWSMSTAIPTGFTCTLSGAGIADTPVTTATGSFVSAAIGNKSLYKISCVSATETISGDATVEVIPNIQEV